MSITRKEVEHVAQLACLALTEEEKKDLEQQLAKILDYINKLNELDTSQVEPTAHPSVVAAGAVWRDDRARPWKDVESVLKNAPEREENFFKVRKVIE